jgi:methylated-DNA-protein-cysteine methyltransferase-like protein
VVNRTGLLSGKHHFDPQKPMTDLLAAENIQVIEDRICDFERLFWNPESLL